MRQVLAHKRKRRDRFPNLAASHAPSASVRRTRRGARLATIPCGTANGQWTTGSPPITTIFGARPFHAHGSFASDPSTGFPSALPSREGRRRPVEDDFGETLQRPISSFRHREEPYGPSLRPLPFRLSANSIELRKRNLLPRRASLQARESTDSGGLAG